jgi:hypothetical protein
MKNISLLLCCFFTIHNCIAQVTAKKVYTKINFSAHAPMFGATIDVKKNTFSTITNEGKTILKKLQHFNKNINAKKIIIQSIDGTLQITLTKKDCPYEVEPSQWGAHILINKIIYKACAYWE